MSMSTSTITKQKEKYEILTALAGDHAIQQQQQHGAHDRHDPVRRIVIVPGKHFAQPRPDKRARDTEEHGDDAAAGIPSRH